MSRPPVVYERHSVWQVVLFEPVATSVPNGYCREEDRRHERGRLKKARVELSAID
jgi:hypothetical protein